jgi:hypothetical protein
MLRRLGLGLLAALVVALIALNALAWSGSLIDEEKGAPQQMPQAGPSAPPTGSDFTPPASRPEAQPIARQRPSKPLEKAKTSGTMLILAAARGDCWVEVRAGSATGPSLYSGTLTSGSTLRFNRPKLWLRLGAASNVDVMVNGRPSTVPSGTVELTVPDA